MANFKNKRPRNGRAGCKMCKPHKAGNGYDAEKEVYHTGFGKIRRLAAAKADMKNY